MKKKIYIVGAGCVGGHVALNINEYLEEFEIEGFFDDDAEKIGTEQFGFRVLGPVNDVLKLRDAAVVIGIAFPVAKREILKILSVNTTLRYPSLIHNKAWISKNVSIGKGCIIYPGSTINFGSEIRDFVVVNANCSLGHHTNIGRYSSLAPGVNTGGHTIIEEAVEVGIGVSTLQEIRVGTNSVVGGQSMLIRDVWPYTTVAGVPAKVIRSNVKRSNVNRNSNLINKG